MLLEIGLIWWFIEFEKSHEWRQRPLRYDIVGAGKKHKNIRHDHGFYPDGSNSGYFKEGGVRADDRKNLKKYNKYPPQKGEMCRYPHIMKQAEKNIAKDFRADNYHSTNNYVTKVKSNNCHDYKKAVNKEYERLFNEANKKNNNKNNKKISNRQNIKKQKRRT